MKTSRFIPVIAGALAAACAPVVQQPAGTPATPATSSSVIPLPASNPFAMESVLPYQAPDFTKIREAHYEPAYTAV